MVDFRMKLFVLAGLATAFAGMASAQTLCTTATANAVFDRSESNDDQVADTTVTCTTAGGTAAGTISMTVYMSPSVNITSATNVGTSAKPLTEAVAGLTANFVAGVTTASGWVNGTISGNSVTFSGIVTAACAPGPACAAFTVTISNIKIASSTVATGSGVPTGISETIFVSGTNTTPAAITTGSAVAYVTSGLSVSTSSKTIAATANPLCNATTTYTAAGVAFNPNFNVSFSEAFPNSFKIGGTAVGNATLGSWYTNHTETGLGLQAGGLFVATTANTATSGTRIKIIFNNIPANVSVYMPLAFAGTNAGALTMTATETGAQTAVSGSSANGAPGATSSTTPGNASTALLTPASGSATVIYEVTAVSSAPATFTIPVYLQAASGAVVAPTTAITTTVSFAPIGATSNVPNFVNGASTTTASGSTFSACATTLMFPFVTNQAGFESGLAISNTGADLLGTKNGAPVSSITGQSGTCTLTFFGNATASSNPPAFTTAAAVAPGTTWTGTLTSVTGGTPNTFGGYMFAACNFLYAHGFTYITYNIGQSNAMAMGYLALAVNTPRTNTAAISVSVPAVVGGVAAAGGSTPVAVGSGTPEALEN